MAMAIVAVAFTACTDNIDNAIQTDVVIPEGTNLMQLERYSYELPFEIKSDTEWKIEFDFEDGQICYATPNHGTGSQTVKLCVIDNPGKEKRTGKMYIDFPKDESKNQIIDLQQNGLVNGMHGAVDLPLGNRAYVVGYGYNVLAERASMNSVSQTPIIKIAKANDDSLMVVGPMDASFVAKTYSGSSVSELSNDLSTDMSVRGKYLGFKGEVGASFGMKDFSKQENEYAISYVEADMQSVNMEMSTTEIINTYMTDAAYDDINGLPTQGRRHVTDTKYPSTEEGLAKLVQTYGTHLVMSARLGGCMKYIMTVDISQVEGSYDLKAYANCSYDYALVKIFDKIWMRENYRAMRKEDGDKFGNNYDLEPLWGGWDGVSCAYYNEEMVTATAGQYHFAPTGWRVPIASDFLDIDATLKANDVPSSTAKAFYRDSEGGFLGFNMVYVGIKFISNPNVAYNVGSTPYPVLKDGKYDGFVDFDKDSESFGQHWWTWGNDECVPVRLVQDIY